MDIWGASPETITKTFESPYSGKITQEVELFTWEKLDHINEIKKEFNLI